jgi:hypothetical protein
MAMFDSNIDYTNFIQFTSEGGLRIATFPEIRDALVRRYMEIYGNDIDTSSASADGQFINSIALIIHNMCDTFQFAFKQMNPNTATGAYLDTLCSYNNVQRISETNSTAELLIYNNSDADIPGRDLLFMDRNGNIWEWICPITSDNTPRVSFKHGSATPITDVECLTTGAIQAFGSKFIKANGQQTDDVNENDWTKECPATIYQFVADETDLRVWQYQDAVMGRNTETDESLRSRRTQMIGVNSLSILEGLEGALLNITGIKDVFIYNNPTNNQVTLMNPIDDGTAIAPHSIYVALRKEDGYNIDLSTIASIIYNKLTPGVGTTEADSSGEDYSIDITDSISYTIYWRNCPSINPYIQIEFKTNSNYNFPSDPSHIHSAETEVEKNMVKNIQEFLANVRIDEYLQISQLLNVVQQSDIQKAGQPTLWALEGRVQYDAETYEYRLYPMNLQYFKYNDDDYKFVYNGTGCTIKIGTEII